MIRPKISIVTVCYNAVDTIEKTIHSVINQTYDNIEYIIVDGASTDGTLDIIKKYEEYVTRWVSEPDKGIYDAMNKGIALATGEWINFMNAGDVFFDNKVLSRVANYADKDADVLFGDVACLIDEKLYRLNAVPFYEHLPLHHSMGFNHQSTFVKTRLAKIIKFDLKYKLAADYNMIITIYREGGVFKQLHDTIIAVYDTNGISSKKFRLHLYETLMVDRPAHIVNLLKSYSLSISQKLKNRVRYIVKLLFPNFFLRRNLQNIQRI